MLKKNYFQGIFVAVMTAPLAVSTSLALNEPTLETNVLKNTQLVQETRQEYLRELLKRGRELVDIGEYSEAIQFYQQAARLDPENAKIFSGLGYLEASLENYQSASWAYQRAVTLDPTNAEFYHALGHTLAKLEAYTEATTAYYRSMELDPNKVESYLGLAAVLLRQEDQAGALSIYKKLLTIEPNHAEALQQAGALFIRQGHYAAAIEHLRKSIEISPQKATAWLDLALAYQQQGRLPFALKTIETFLQQHPNHARGYYQKGKLLQEEGRLNAASSAYRMAIRLDNQLVEALVSLGDVQLRQKQYPQAVETYRRLERLVPDNPGIYYNLGLALKGEEELTAARKAFQRAYQLFGEVRNQEGKDRSQMQLRNL